jgi:hypothetical protein
MKIQNVFLERTLIIIPLNANIKVFILFFFVQDHFTMTLSGCSYFMKQNREICTACFLNLSYSVRIQVVQNSSASAQIAKKRLQ